MVLNNTSLEKLHCFMYYNCDFCYMLAICTFSMHNLPKLIHICPAENESSFCFITCILVYIL